MLALLLAAALAPSSGAAPTSSQGLRDVAPALRELPTSATADSLPSSKGLIDPFDGASTKPSTSGRCTKAQQAAGATTVRCRTRLRSPFG